MTTDTDPPPPPSERTSRDVLIIPPGAALEILNAAVDQLADSFRHLERVAAQIARQLDASATK